jgi:hypothetical protein
MSHRLTAVAVVFFVAVHASATSFVVPSDDELVGRSVGIVIGNVEGSFVRDREGVIETIAEIRLERAIKGSFRAGELISVTAPGGVLDATHGVIVPASPRYRQGERVLVFLTRDKRGEWETTDLTLGRFEFVTSTAGERLLVRNLENVVGWDHAGKVHHEKVRRESGFLAFIEDRVLGRRPRAPQGTYEVDAEDVTLSTESATRMSVVSNAAPFPGATYTDWANNQPIRWPNMPAGVTFYKRSDQNISGAADGGVSAIQNGLAAWNNECESLINLIYGGQRATASANFDGINVVEFNDPQGRVSGSWTGSGTVAITFLSFSGEHTFASQTWLNISGADVVFQDGFPATNSAFPAAMTHELGHGIGWRHSNQDYATGGACNSATQECTSAAIMNSSVSGNYGFTLQPWDIHAAQSVYPGGSCGPTCTPPGITSQPPSTTVAAGSSTTLTLTATGTETLTYQWYIGSSGNTSNPISGATSRSLTVRPGATTSYWVRVTNSCGSANSSTATVTVSMASAAPSTASGLYLVSPCRVYDSRNSTALSGGETRLIQVTGVCGIPSDAKAVAFNATGVTPSGNGYLVVFPGVGGSVPNTTTLSYRAGRTRANNGVMRLSTAGALGFYNGGPAVHFIIDVTGYFR